MRPPKYYIGIFLILVILLILITFGIFFVLKEIESKSVIELINPVNEISASLDFNNKEENQKSLEFAPKVIKAVYLTSWSASRQSKINHVINLAKTTEVNSVVIDIKDYSGYVAYDSNLPKVIEYGAKRVKIPDVKYLIDQFHKEGIYTIARIVVFQDPVLAKNRPDLAIHQKSEVSLFLRSFLASISLWLDNLKLAWMDPAAEEVWDYNISIAKEALELGFDEINFDYIRFPSDGELKKMDFSVWDGKTPRHVVIKNFFKRIREGLPDAKISIDLFGLSTVNRDDLGVGQIIEDGYEYFDYVSPMVYPSHYAKGFLGYEEPAKYPYQVVKYSMDIALKRLTAYNQAQGKNAKLRPWLQDFNLRGVPYTKEMVAAEIKAVSDASGENFNGFMLWNPWNIYTKDALGSSE